MRSQPAIHCFRSGLHEPGTSHPHAKMHWHRWFHPNTLDRSALACFHVPAIALAIHITPGPKPMFRKNRTHSIQRFRMHYPCAFPSQIPPSHIRQAMHAWSRLCPHTPGTPCYPNLVFVCSKYSRPVSAWEIDWHRMTSGLSFFCCMALGSFHKLFPSHPERHARPNHVQ